MNGAMRRGYYLCGAGTKIHFSLPCRRPDLSLVLVQYFDPLTIVGVVRQHHICSIIRREVVLRIELRVNAFVC